jgi:hypothetical protein
MFLAGTRLDSLLGRFQTKYVLLGALLITLLLISIVSAMFLWLCRQKRKQITKVIPQVMHSESANTVHDSDQSEQIGKQVEAEKERPMDIESMSALKRKHDFENDLVKGTARPFYQSDSDRRLGDRISEDDTGLPHLKE